MKRFLPILLLPLLASCFHKNVMTDRADDVVKSFLYTGKEGAMIITKEMIFQATSKESNGGMTTISGNAEYRISSYDLATGNLLGRADMGDGIEKSFTVMGAADGKIWLYSIDPDLGFHCRNPKTMELISNEKTLAANGPLKGFSFARPEWMKLGDHYGWNAKNGLLMLTDMQGYHYYYDPAKGKLDKTEDQIPDYQWSVRATNSNGYFAKDDYASINGTGRQKLQYRYEDSTGKLSYLNGAILIDNNPLRKIERERSYIESLHQHIAAWEDSIAKLKQQFPDLGEEINPRARYNEAGYMASHKLGTFNRELEDVQRDLKRTEEPHFSLYDNAVLSDATGNFFILHATDVSDTARLNLTKLHLEGRNFTETWTTKLADFYRDPGKADNKGAFETVFSDGDPRFGYQWFEISGDKLVLISQLQMACLDLKTGKIIWQKPV